MKKTKAASKKRGRRVVGARGRTGTSLGAPNAARRHAAMVAAAATRLEANTDSDQLRPVTFSTDSSNHFVGITAGLISGSGPSTVSLMLPVGSYTIHWRVTGSGSFELKAQGATLAAPITSVAPDAGPIGITVA